MSPRARKITGFVIAALLGAALSLTGRELGWGEETQLLVGGALVVAMCLVIAPWVLIPRAGEVSKQEEPQ